MSTSRITREIYIISPGRFGVRCPVANMTRGINKRRETIVIIAILNGVLNPAQDLSQDLS